MTGLEGLPLGEQLRDATLAKSAKGRGDRIAKVRDWLLSERWQIATPDTNTLTGDDVMDACEALGYTDGDSRWTGSVLRGWPAVRATGMYQQSRRPECHARPKLVWMWV